VRVEKISGVAPAGGVEGEAGDEVEGEEVETFAGVAPDREADDAVEDEDVGTFSGIAPDRGVDDEAEDEDAGTFAGVAPDREADDEVEGEAAGEVEGEGVFMASPVGCGVRLSPSPGLSLVDLIRSPLWGGVLLDIWTGAATWTGDLSLSLLGLAPRDRDRVGASGTLEPA